MPQVVIVIPARLASTRLPSKPLADIHGKPMIQWVYERSKKARGIARTLVATDDEKVARVVRSFGGEAIMTSPDLQSGTDRVAAVALEVPADIYVNVQGDEPLIDPVAIEKAVALVSSGEYSMGTIMVPIRDHEELIDTSVVKVLSDRSGRAIYFSRFPIPYSRGEIPSLPSNYVCKRHVGLYVYRKETLLYFRDLPVSAIEKGEVLEQLRALESGIPIGIAEANFISLGVDTPLDLEKVRRILV